MTKERSNLEIKLLRDYIADLEKGLESSLNLNKAQAARHTDNEPVAWMEYIQGEEWEVWFVEPTNLPKGHTYKPLYTHPVDESFDRTASHMAGEYVSYPAKTLTDEEIWKLWVKHLNDDIVVFARAILKKASKK